LRQGLFNFGLPAWLSREAAHAGRSSWLSREAAHAGRSSWLSREADRNGCDRYPSKNPASETMSQQHLCFFSTRCRYSQTFLEELSRTPYSREFRFVCVDATPGGLRPSLPPYVRAVPTLMIAGEHEPRTDAQVMNWLSERRLMDRTGAVPTSTVPGGARPPVGNVGSGGMAYSMPTTPAAAASYGPASGGGGSSSAGAGVSVVPPMALNAAAPLADSTGVGPMAFGGSEFMIGGGDEGFAYIGEEGVSHEKGNTFVRMMGNMANFNDLGAATAPIGTLAAPGFGVASGTSSAAAAATSVRGGGPSMSVKAKTLETAFDSFRSARDRDAPSGIKRM
jgi:hypothetical protein